MDSKLQTFLVLCRLMNYRMTSEELHLTQPAVTKQIQSLERMYNTKLFVYDGKRLQKTKDCQILEAYAQSLQHNYEEIKKALSGKQEIFIRIGATKTIGDYVIGNYILKYLEDPNHNLSLLVDNTEHLLRLLDSSQIDFALIEGLFSKQKYEYQLLRKESFVGICSKNHRFCGKKVSIQELLNETIIVREVGSGTRDILEHELRMQGYDVQDFRRVIDISSFKLIRELVLEGVGISLLYQSVVDKDGRFGTFQVEDINLEHEFNIVYLKNTNAQKYVELFLKNNL